MKNFFLNGVSQLTLVRMNPITQAQYASIGARCEARFRLMFNAQTKDLASKSS